MKRKSAAKDRSRLNALTLGAGVMILSVLCGEITVRYLAPCDADGNCQLHVMNKFVTLKPYHMPVSQVSNLLTKFRLGQSYLTYDSALGWVQRPNSSSENGLYHANRDGVRKALSTDSTTTGEHRLRVVLLGDSYTHGDEVPFEQTWGAYLEQKLAGAGIQAEVINLGVPGYGMDQALLRWKHSGAAWSPDLVIFGFQPENVKRNLNLARIFYHRQSRMPFFKPRFIWADRFLEAVNAPTPSPDELLDLYGRFDTWDTRRYEYYYRTEDYQDHIWLKSKLVAACLAWIEQLVERRDESAFYAIGNEPSQLALAILRELRADVEGRGADFLVPLFIPKWDFHYVAVGQPLQYQDFLEAVKKDYDSVETAQQLRAHMNGGNFDEFFSGNHYSGKANEIVANVIAEAIAQRQSKKHRLSDRSSSTAEHRPHQSAVRSMR